MSGDGLPVDQVSPLPNPGERGDGTPVAPGDRDPRELVERAEIADDLHVAPVQAEDEPVVPHENFQAPLLLVGDEALECRADVRAAASSGSTRRTQRRGDLAVDVILMS